MPPTAPWDFRFPDVLGFILGDNLKVEICRDEAHDGPYTLRETVVLH